MNPPEIGHLAIDPQSLLIFVDETGHEFLSDPNYPIFGLGGCAITASAYVEVVAEPWRRWKDEHFEGIDIPFHAAELYGMRNNAVEALGEFFRIGRFSRFGAIIKNTTTLDKAIEIYAVIAGAVVKRIEEVARFYTFGSLTFIFEASERANKFAERYFPSYKFRDAKGREFPVSWYFMPKATSEPGLEIADCIIHTAGGQVCSRMNGKQIWRKDFECVFRSID
jgi:hypothetical protein